MCGMINLNYFIDHILFLIFKIILIILTYNPVIKIYINKIENRIASKIKSRYYLQLLTPKTMKLLGSTEYKITKDKNGENIPHWSFTVHHKYMTPHNITTRKDPNNNIADSESFIFKGITKGRPLDAGNTEDLEVAVPLKYLSNFWRTLEMSSINCKINLILTW